jgi:hypothetical protein
VIVVKVSAVVVTNGGAAVNDLSSESQSHDQYKAFRIANILPAIV